LFGRRCQASAIALVAFASDTVASVAAIVARYSLRLIDRTDIEHFASERAREEREVAEVPQREVAEVTDILRSYGLDEEDAARVVKSIKADKKRWVDFMMRFEVGLEEPDPSAPTPTQVSFIEVLAKHLRMKGLIVGSRRHQLEMIRAIDASGLKPVVDSIHPLDGLADAFRHQEGHRHFGKICLEF